MQRSIWYMLLFVPAHPLSLLYFMQHCLSCMSSVAVLVALLCFALLLVLDLFLRWHWHCLASFHPFHLLVNARDCVDLEGGVMLGFVWFAALGCIAFIAICCCGSLPWQLRSMQACIWVELLASAAQRGI